MGSGNSRDTQEGSWCGIRTMREVHHVPSDFQALKLVELCGSRQTLAVRAEREAGWRAGV